MASELSPVLALDVGSGTQDALLWFPGRELENCPKFVLPAPARMIAARIAEATAAGLPVFLHGENMGGGFYRAFKAHLDAGLKMACAPEAAFALYDDPARLEAMGVPVTDRRPAGYLPIRLADYEPAFWRGLLAHAGIEPPREVLAAAQDHGFHGGGSNRLGRFRLWQEFLDSSEEGGAVRDLVYARPPEVFTRLATLQRAIGGGPVADTGAAAILGGLADPEVAKAAHGEGALLVNLGNSHVLGFLLRGERALGVYEHHTTALTPDALWAQLEAFRAGTLPQNEVLETGGHGVGWAKGFGPGGFGPTFVLGPRRSLFADRPVSFPAPGGDMMLAGCLGLLRGAGLLV